VDIEANGDSDGLPYNVGWTDAGEWLKFTIQDVTPGTYDLKIRVAAPSSGGIFFAQLNGANLGVIDVPSTGGWYEWQNMVIPEVSVSSGEQFLKIQIVQAGFNIERITFESVNSSIDEPVILDQFMLGDPYPNPFNPSVMMDLTNHEPSEYTISIINLKGKKVYQKSLGVLESGNHSINWNGKNTLGNLSPIGIYFLELSNSKFIENKKLILLR
jgi:hypothetical protein